MTYVEKAVQLIEKQTKWVEQLILAEQHIPICPYSKQPQSQTNLKWAGTQMEFVELLYALHEADCFGKMPLKDLFRIIGQMFGCEIKNYYRLFWNIKNRTGEERGYFLNKLMKKLSEKLFRMDSGGWR